MKTVWRAALATGLALFASALGWPPESETARPSITALIAPLAVGREVGAGFRLAGAHRGEEHDVVLVARRAEPTAVVEVHVLDRGRWPEATVAGAYGVAYEEPRSKATEGELLAVRDAIAAAVRVHPEIATPVDELALEGEPSRGALARALGRLSGARGAAFAISFALAFELLASLPFGTTLAAVALAIVGATLRFSVLDLPFVHDQDVQRAFTGHLPLADVLFGAGLDDRHPPLWFVVLHLAERWGQSEFVLRAPAALAGTLVGPAVAISLGRLRAPLAPVAAAVALATTVSVEGIARSRENSEIPLMALIAVAMVASAAALVEKPRRRGLVAFVTFHVLALFTYYLAPLVIVGETLALVRLRSWPRRARRALVWTLVLGAPALALLVRAALRDAPARLAAHAHASTAWGDRTVVDTARGALALLVESYPVPLLALAVLALCSRRTLARTSALALASALVGLALVAPFARVQPYYQAAVAPLAAVAVGALFSDRLPRAIASVVALAVSVPAIFAARGASPLYVADPRAYVTSRIASAVTARAERTIVVSVAYDATLVAYSLARRADVAIDWRDLAENEGATTLFGVRIIALSRSHDPAIDPREAAARAFDAAIAGGALFLEREPYGELFASRIAARCRLLDGGAAVRLWACE